MSGWVGGAAGEMENKAVSASNLKLKLTEAELGNFRGYVRLRLS